MRTCPKCDNELRLEEITGIQVDGCDSCGGIWLDRGEIFRLRKADSDLDQAEAAFDPAVERHAERPADKCPVCHGGMSQYGYAGSNIELETCEKHCGIWLEEGELSKIGSREQNLPPEARAAIAELEVSSERAKSRARALQSFTRTLMSPRSFFRWFV